MHLHSPVAGPIWRSVADRAVTAAVAVAVGSVVGALLAGPALRALVGWQCPGCRLLTIDSGDAMRLYLGLAGIVGVGLATPVLLYETVRLAAPALPTARRPRAWSLLLPLAFAAGAGAATWIAPPLPPETGWPAGPLVQAVPGSPALWLGAALWLGVASTLPVALPLLAAQEVTSWRRLADGWRYVVVLLLVVAAVAVPSSALGLLILVALPLPLYGLGVVLARLTAARGGRG